MSIKDQILADLKAAMLARDEKRTAALRLIKAEMLKAEKEKGEQLDAAAQMAVLQKMVKQRRDSIEQYEAAGRDDLAETERGEAAVIEDYLPDALSEQEIRSTIDEVVGQGDGAGQLGKVMGQVMGRLKATGRPFDGKAVNQLVKARLGA